MEPRPVFILYCTQFFGMDRYQKDGKVMPDIV
jgi:hypothetical protein